MENPLQNYLGEAANAWDSWTNNNYSTVGKEFISSYALAQQANQHEIDMWNLQNAYNTPAEQMKRFAAAGLNPNLIYQQGNPGNASSAPGTHMASPNIAGAANADEAKRMNNFGMGMQVLEALLGLGSLFQDNEAKYLQNQSSRLELQRQQMAQRIAHGVEWPNGSDVGKNFGLTNEQAKYFALSYFHPKGSKSLVDAFYMPFREHQMNANNYILDYNAANMLDLQRQLLEHKITNTEYQSKMQKYMYDTMNVFSPGQRAVGGLFDHILQNYALPFIPQPKKIFY